MKRKKALAGLGLVAVGLAALLSLAGADEPPAPTANPPVATPPPSQEGPSLQGFALQNPLCHEWSDGCSVCMRDEKDAPHCSTPGVACQPEAIRCRRETTK
jgi:hypothetical protein